MHTTNSAIRRPVPGVRARAVLALFAAAVSLTACKDPFALKAQYANEPFVFSLYGISGKGPANSPAALDFATMSAVRVDGTFAFDVAFDFDSRGKIVVIPQKLVGAAISGARTIGLQRLPGVYETVLEAPARGWQFDSTLTIVPGDVVGVRMTSSGCVYQMSTEIYAKFVVDSVKTGGLLFGRALTDPNCGFKSFATGIPTH